MGINFRYYTIYQSISNVTENTSLPPLSMTGNSDGIAYLLILYLFSEDIKIKTNYKKI